MADQFSDVSSESWLGRIGSSITGILVGFVFIIIALALLAWNEERAVTTAKSLKEGAAAVVSVEAGTVDPSNAQKLIHVSGEATTAEVLSDPTFAISANALRLSRDVAMYQWKEEEKSETKNKLGGGTETVKTYTYERTGRTSGSILRASSIPRIIRIPAPWWRKATRPLLRRRRSGRSG